MVHSFVQVGYTLVFFTNVHPPSRPDLSSNGAYFWYRAPDKRWCLRELTCVTLGQTDTYVVRFLGDHGPARTSLDRRDLPRCRSRLLVPQTQCNSPLHHDILRDADTPVALPKPRPPLSVIHLTEPLLTSFFYKY